MVADAGEGRKNVFQLKGICPEIRKIVKFENKRVILREEIVGAGKMVIPSFPSRG